MDCNFTPHPSHTHVQLFVLNVYCLFHPNTVSQETCQKVHHDDTAMAMGLS